VGTGRDDGCLVGRRGASALADATGTFSGFVFKEFAKEERPRRTHTRSRLTVFLSYHSGGWRSGGGGRKGEICWYGGASRAIAFSK
jgi:hypothetical protein